MTSLDSDILDPFQVLGLPPTAGQAEIRSRYLDLVKQYPPDRDADKFREIRAAFEATMNPLLIARRLLRPADVDDQDWSNAIDAQKAKLPKLSPEFVMSLGNRPS